MGKHSKSEQLQIRVTSLQKRLIQQAAARSGLDMSTYVLARVLRNPAEKFHELCADCSGPDWRYALAEVNSLLSNSGADQLKVAVASAPTAKLTPYIMNYIAAMVEQSCAKRAIAAPRWTHAVDPLTEPVFGSKLKSLRLYLLIHSPPSFRRRNIFIDSSVGARV